MKKEIIEWEQKERSLNEQIKKKIEQIYELTKKTQNQDGEMFILQEKLRQVETNTEERRSSDEKMLRDKDKQLSQKSEELTTIQLELMTVKEELASSTQESSIRGN